MRIARPRMVEARYVFQTTPTSPDNEYCQFAVSVFRRGDGLHIAFDLHGADAGVVENVDITVLDAIRVAVDLVKDRVKVAELHEQHE